MKTLSKLLVLVMTLTIAAGCGDSNDSGGGNVVDVTTADGILEFMPADVTVSVGDTVRFELTPTHNALEVSEETYDARGITPLDGGFEVDFGQTGEITFDSPGVHYYVCTPHVSADMIGTITVR
ncbi:MAG: plastocyanin/azurin family copper-binding protein [Myxococcota bacterium]